MSNNCQFAIENTMITHNPEVKEKLEELGIPVMIERSSYEKHPLGRLEWIRLFGVLFNREQQANEFSKSRQSVSSQFWKKKIPVCRWHFLRYLPMELLQYANRTIMYLP